MELIELNYNQFDRILPLSLESEHMKFIVESMLYKSPMRVWVDDYNDPKSAIMWDKAHICYILGYSNNLGFNLAIKNLFLNTIIKSSLEFDISTIKIEFVPKDWDLIIEKYLQKLKPLKNERIFLALENFNIPKWEKILPEKFKVVRINKKLLDSQIRHVESIKDELSLMWDSINDFFNNGFGFCTLQIKDNETSIVGWCTGEYFSKKMCGIGIETFRNYERRGIATAMASAFVEHALSVNVKPHWDAALSNKASLKVAEKVGFEPIQKFTTYLCSL